MELIYSMRRKPLKCEPPHFETASDPEVIRPIVTVSSSNIVAFSSPTALNDVEGDTWGGHVYVCDLDTPWNSYKVTTTEHPVSALQWDQEGNKLLVATSEGHSNVYGQRDYQLNDWKLLYSCYFPGEHIIECTFFHNGRRVVCTDKKADAPLTDRYTQLRPTPTLKGFGGAACEGICVLTGSGVIGVLAAPTSPGPAPSAAPAPSPGPAPAPPAPRPHTHAATKDHVCAADMKHQNGNIVIACVCKSSNCRARVRVFVCRVTQTSIMVQPLAAIHLNTSQTPNAIAWWLGGEVDALLIAGSNLTLWKRVERPHAVHKLFSKGPVQGNTTPGSVPKPNNEVFNSLVWVQTAVWTPPEGGMRLATSPPSLPAQAVLVSPTALYLVAPGSHHFISSVTVNTSGGNEPVPAASPPKKPKYSPGQTNRVAVVCGACVCAGGGAAVCVDSLAQLHLYRLPRVTDPAVPVSVSEVTSMLEYCMVSGHDSLDILYSLTPAMAESVYDRFTESFQRQSPGFQQYYYHSWLKIRIALCRCSSALANSEGGLTALQMLHALHAAAALSPAPDDKTSDDDKAGAGLETRAEAGEGAGLRRPLLRVLHLAATVLASLANTAAHHYDLTTDPLAISLLRRLLPACGGHEPLLRPLARLLQLNFNYKQDFIDECQSISSMVCMTRVWECLPRVAVSAPITRPKPLYLEYGVEPEVLKYAPEPPSMGQYYDITPTLDMDTIRYMYLGGGGRVCRQRVCGRCGARGAAGGRGAGGGAGGSTGGQAGGSSGGPAGGAGGAARAPGAAAPRATTEGAAFSPHPLQRAYDARFLAKCRCGGRWSVISNI